MCELLEDAFRDGRLVRPSDHQPNLAHLVRALAALSGVGDVPQNHPVNRLMDMIGTADHYIFILLDGLGMNLVPRMPPSSFVASRMKMQIHATCPSTTACALTTVATADYANRHGVSGWFTHLPEFDLTAITLPFQERFTKQPLVERGIRPEQVFPLPSIHPRMTHQPLSLTPAYIAQTPYNIYSRGGTQGEGYRSTAEAVDMIIARITTASGPTYTYLYLHDIDTLCHAIGVDDPGVLPLVMQIDNELGRLADALAGRARIVVSADHGLIDVPKKQQTLLLAGDPLLEMLRVPPTGDARMPVFFVREGQHEAFAAMFRQRFGGHMALLHIDQAESMELFGPGAFSPVARRRFGDFIAFPCQPATLTYHPPDRPMGHLYLAVHAGLSPEEVWVPLCLA